MWCNSRKQLAGGKNEAKESLNSFNNYDIWCHNYISFILFFDAYNRNHRIHWGISSNWSFLVIIIVIKLLLNLAAGVYNIINRYLDYKDIAKIVLVAFGTNALIVIYLSIPGVTKFMPRSVYLFITTLEVFGLVSFRLSRKLIDYYKYIIENRNLVGKRTIIIGAGSAAELAIKEINSNKNLHNTIIGLLDDDDNKITRTISNYKVLGPISSLKEQIIKYNIEEIIMAINNYPKHLFNDLIN